MNKVKYIMIILIIGLLNCLYVNNSSCIENYKEVMPYEQLNKLYKDYNDLKKSITEQVELINITKENLILCKKLYNICIIEKDTDGLYKFEQLIIKYSKLLKNLELHLDITRKILKVVINSYNNEIKKYKNRHDLPNKLYIYNFSDKKIVL